MDPRLRPGIFWARLRAALDAVDAAAKQPPPDARAGAVLVLLEETDEGPRVVLTRRRRDLPSHPGQVSFAGGRIDPGEGVEEAALREAEEEIGLQADSVELVGVGPRFYIPPSRFWVVPVVARWVEPHDLNPNPWEVDAILHVPVSNLLDERRWRHVPLSDHGSSWAWQLDEDLLWGATAIVMALLLEVAVEGWSGGAAPETLPEDRAVRPWEQAPAWQRRVRLTQEGLPEVPQHEVPHVTGEQMREVDRILLDEAGLSLSALVEHAGRAVAHATRRLVDDDLAGVGVTVLAGTGGNGAGGLAAARLLAAAGADVAVSLAGDPRLPEQLAALEVAGVLARPFARGIGPRDVVVDALLGYGAQPPLRGTVADALGWLQRHDVPVVALDLPSGMTADRLEGLCVTADVTVTLAAPKVALRAAISHPYVGDLYLADLGVPASIWPRVGVEPIAVFGRGPLVRLTLDAVASDAGTPDQGRIET